MYPPRDEGWFADDLDHFPEAPRHTELIDGVLVFALFPRQIRHTMIVDELRGVLGREAPEGINALREIAVKLDGRNRVEADVLLTTGPGNSTFLTPDQVLLVIEVISPESAYHDRMVKLRKYAESGIAHCWLVEEEDGTPVVHTYGFDGPGRSYVPTGIHRHELRSRMPFPIELNLDSLPSGLHS